MLKKLTAIVLTAAMLLAAVPTAYAADIDELARAEELGFVSASDVADPERAVTFAGFDALLRGLIQYVDASALTRYDELVDAAAFPDRAMLRDDGLILLFLAAEALGYTVYNARDYGFCTENAVDYNAIFAQLSWDYPYCDAERETLLYFAPDEPDEPIGNTPATAVYWMQRRMDIHQRVHFFDYEGELDFRFNEPLSCGDAVSAVMRLYNSETLDWDYNHAPRVPTHEDAALLREVELKKQEILNNQDTLPCQGTAYYVSPKGDDANDGLAPETAWATLEQVNTANLSHGDGVYFERGGTWRGQLWAQEGVIYSAYGEGEKPKIYASPENGADPAKWTLLEGTDNIWVYHIDMMDCGILVFNDGESWGTKVVPYYMDGYLSTISDGQSFDVRSELTEDLMFFSQADSILYDGAPFRYTIMDTCDRGEYSEEVVGTLYLRCDAGNPGDVFDNIEFAVRQNIVLPADDAVFHNLCLKYTGAHCIYGYDMSYDVSFCEIGWIGGSPQYYRYDNGEPVILGNGVECGGSYDHYSVTDCFIYQCYDAGVSNQDPSEDPAVTGNENFESYDVIQRNITYARNVFAYNDMPIEIFFTLEDDVGYGRHRMENVLIEDNYFLYTGYGWYMGTKGAAGSAYMGHNAPNASENFRIVNNVFYLSTGPLLQTGAPKKWQPVLDGNTYVQNEGNELAYWTTDDEGYGRPEMLVYEKDTVEGIVRDVLGDENATLLLADPISFTDVTNPADWFHDPVYAAANAGIVAGGTDGAFVPYGKLSWAQTVTFAVRLAQYNGGEPIYGAASQQGYANWYDVYVNYALSRGIIDAVPDDPNGDITRGEAARVFAAVYEGATDVNTVADGYFADVPYGSAAYDAVYTLARAGIVNGKPDAATGVIGFGTDDTFQRCEVATIVARMAGLVQRAKIN